MKLNLPVIKSKDDAKRWNFWIKQDFFNPTTFPEWIVDLLIKSHLKHFEGYHLFYFMTANGFDKHKMADILSNIYTYDKTKIGHLLKSSEKESFYNKRYFDLIERRVINIEES